ncbi:MAG TPA: hypothetical protein VFE69_10960 [Ilumatobacteraceae bacterium]|nr:hypothetical protein [Ilumatobacteraceae bacterium]
MSSSSGDRVKVGVGTPLVVIRWDCQHRALGAAKRVTSRRTQQPGKSASFPDAEHDQICLQIFGVPHDLVDRQANGDLSVHSSIELLGYRQQRMQTPPRMLCEQCCVVERWRLQGDPWDRGVDDVHDVQQRHRAVAFFQESNRLIQR